MERVSRRGFITSAGVGVVGAAALGGEAEAASATVLAAGRAGADHAARQRPRCARCRSLPRTTLLEALREHLGLAGTKPGCERGECGACTVLIDGETRYACQMLALEAEGHEVTTIEGLAKGEELSDVQKAFVAEDAMQCGYCIPGQVMAVEGLLRHEKDPSLGRDPRGRERQPLPLRRLRPHLQGRAARRRSAPQRGEVSHDRHARSPLDRDARSSARAQPRIDAHERVSGSAVYARDLVLPDMLHAAFARCPHAHARVKKVDTTKALAMPGVRAVITGRQPRREAAVLLHAEGPAELALRPALPARGRGGRGRRGRDAARRPARRRGRSRSSTRSCRSSWTSRRRSIPGRPPLHEGGNRVGEPDKYERGDVAKGFAEADGRRRDDLPHALRDPHARWRRTARS